MQKDVSAEAQEPSALVKSPGSTSITQIQKKYGRPSANVHPALSHAYTDILPKNPNARPELYVEWENLTLACEKCNRSGKKDYYNEAEPLLNPYKDDINNELVSVGAFIFPRHGSRRANISIDVLKFNRPELLERRGEAVKRIEELIDRYYNEKNTYYKDIILNEINEEIAEDKEYSFVLKGVFEAMK